MPPKWIEKRQIVRRFFLIPDETGRLMWPEDFAAREAAREAAASDRAVHLASAQAAATTTATATVPYDRRQWELAEYGFEDDGYDYMQHFRSIGGGTFVTAAGEVLGRPPPIDGEAPIEPDAASSAASSATSDGKGKKKEEETTPAKEKEDKEGEHAPVEGDVMSKKTGFVAQERDDSVDQRSLYHTVQDVQDIDPDVAAALSDFVAVDATAAPSSMAATAKKKKEKLPTTEGDQQEEDESEVLEVEEGDMPDDFIAQMLEANEDEIVEVEEEDDGDAMDDEFDDDDEECGEGDEDEGRRRRRRTEETDALEEALDDVMEEYGDDDIGALSGDEGTRGAFSVQEILQFADAGGNGGDEEQQSKPKREPRRRLARKFVDKVKDDDPTVPPAPEDRDATLRLIRGQEQRGQSTTVVEVAVEPGTAGNEEEDEEERWDCESVLTMRSTSSYIPTVLGAKPQKAKPTTKTKKQTTPTQQQTTPPQIRLNRRTGMPVVATAAAAAAATTTDEASDDDTDGGRLNLGEKRHRETAEERRQRKKAVKEARKERRVQKKEKRTAYKEAEATQTRIMQAQSVTAGGQSTVRL